MFHDLEIHMELINRFLINVAFAEPQATVASAPCVRTSTWLHFYLPDTEGDLCPSWGGVSGWNLLFHPP